MSETEIRLVGGPCDGQTMTVVGAPPAIVLDLPDGGTAMYVITKPGEAHWRSTTRMVMGR